MWHDVLLSEIIYPSSLCQTVKKIILSDLLIQPVWKKSWLGVADSAFQKCGLWGMTQANREKDNHLRLWLMLEFV